MMKNLHIRHKEKTVMMDNRQSLFTSLASSVSTRRCDAAGAEAISQLITEKVTGEALSLSSVEGGRSRQQMHIMLTITRPDTCSNTQQKKRFNVRTIL